jgi:hypothetical protein
MSIPFYGSLEVTVPSGVFIQATDGTNTVGQYYGAGTPEGVVAAPVGSLYQNRTNGSLWSKTSGTGNTGWSTIAGSTNLAVTQSATNVVVTSDTGTDATIPLADGTNAGVMSPSQFSKLGFITVTQSVDLDAMEQDVADLTTLTGVASNATNLGTFTGTTIADNVTVKTALQSLETALEAVPLRKQSVVADITARDALASPLSGDLAWVVSAIGDATVTSGAALYVYSGAAWVKVSEVESMDLAVNLSLSNIGTTTIDVNSNLGTDVTLPQAVADTATGANDGTAGLLNSADKLKVSRLNSFVQTIGDGTATAYTVTHNLGTLDVDLRVVRVSDGAVSFPAVTVTSTTTAVVTFGVAPAANTFRVLVTRTATA